MSGVARAAAEASELVGRIPTIARSEQLNLIDVASRLLHETMPSAKSSTGLGELTGLKFDPIAAPFTTEHVDIGPLAQLFRATLPEKGNGITGTIDALVLHSRDPQSGAGTILYDFRNVKGLSADVPVFAALNVGEGRIHNATVLGRMSDTGEQAIGLFAGRDKIVSLDGGKYWTEDGLAGKRILTTHIDMDKGKVRFDVGKPFRQDFRDAPPWKVADLEAGTHSQYRRAGDGVDAAHSHLVGDNVLAFRPLGTDPVLALVGKVPGREGTQMLSRLFVPRPGEPEGAARVFDMKLVDGRTGRNEVDIARILFNPGKPPEIRIKSGPGTDGVEGWKPLRRLLDESDAAVKK